ncbi:hypothetical protein WJU23_20215 [Prosthecobacter sp. SYSU 5D2]|uniref:hypothetical protein n=1 Tax=Prosthecobacter sp. SYSU 5D2 TaxID=3134134 RepID=UPI0031FE5E42
MKRIFQILFLAVAVLGLSSCATYDQGYVSSRPVGHYRSSSLNQGVLYTSSNRYYRGSPVSYRSSSRYGHRDYGRRDRHDRYDRDRHDGHRNVRYSPRSSRSSRSAVDARVRTNLGIFR